MPTSSLEQAMTPNGLNNLQAFGGIVLTAALFGRNLLHLHRPAADDHADDLNGEFWTRHRSIENILLQTSLGMPDHMRVPNGLQDPNVIFTNMSMHTSAICLHQAAIFKADKHHLPVNISNESKIRCVTAGVEIASLMRMISHMDLATVSSLYTIQPSFLIMCTLLTTPDESFHIFLCIRRSTSVRPIPENPPERSTNGFITPISIASYASPSPQKPSHRIFPCSVGSRS